MPFNEFRDHRHKVKSTFISCSTKGLVLTAIVLEFTGCGGDRKAPQVSNPVQAAQRTIPEMPAETPVPRIIEQSLFKQNDFYGIRGTVFNPTDRAMKNVSIKYYLFKSRMGNPKEGTLVATTGGLVEAKLMYLPPKTPVAFVAFDETAPTGGRAPEISAEITAEWD